MTPETSKPNKIIVSLSLDPDVVALLDALADRERRSRSAMAEIIFADAIAAEQAHLEAKSQAKE
jgi:predicted transcriptional regulator